MLSQDAQLKAARMSDELVCVPFSEPKPGRTVALAWRASFPRTKAIDCLLNALQEISPTETENER